MNSSTAKSVGLGAIRALNRLCKPVLGGKVFGPITVKDGNRLAIWFRNGKVQTIDGPAEPFCKLNQIESLERHVASPSQYLEVDLKDGTKEYIPGPCSLFFDSVKHNKISLESKNKINANEAMIVYKTDENGDTKREILRGPMLYSPTAKSEWFHQFKWHFPEQVLENKGLTQSGVLRFITIRLLADHMYFDIPNVRTQDDALIRLKTMVFFQIEDLELMLDSTHDPINVMINGMIADIMEYTATKELDNFKENSEELNCIETYPQLTKRAEGIGYLITKVVFRGFESDSKLQKMHDDAIQKRTEIKLQKERERAQQELENFKLTSKLERYEREKQLQFEVHQQEMKLLKEKRDEEMMHLRSCNDEKMRFYKQMRDEVDVDITEIIRAENENIANTKIIRIDGNTQNANFHHHIDSDNSEVIAKATKEK